MQTYTTFQPRAITSLPSLSVGGFHIKRYVVAAVPSLFDETRFADAQHKICALLPRVDATRGRPGAAFLILHQGVTGDYAVLSWWDRQNELPTHVWTRHEDRWAPARSDEHFCVWDLELLWFERNAWVETVLSGAPLEPSLADYQRRTFPESPG